MTDTEINKLTVSDVLDMAVFHEEMQRQVEIEQDTHTRELQFGRLKRTPLDSIRERGAFDGDTMVQLFAAVIDKSLVGFSSAERQYIYGVGMLCFGRVLNRLREI